MKLLIIGHARHGKDTLAEYLRDRHGFRVADSSRRAAEIFLFDKLKDKYGYKDFEECFRDRVNRRAEWFDEITKYNTPDKTRLARNILANSDIYVGMRSREEVMACRAVGLFDFVIWVDASERLPPEPVDSCQVDVHCAHLSFNNNGKLGDFAYHAERLLHSIGFYQCWRT